MNNICILVQPCLILKRWRSLKHSLPEKKEEKMKSNQSIFVEILLLDILRD